MVDSKKCFDELKFGAEDEWLSARRQFIGSSEVAALFGLGYASQSPYALWLEKTKGVAVPFGDEDGRVLEYGKMAEPFIRKVFEFETGHHVHHDADPVIRRSRLWPDIGATIDGWIEPEPGVLEVTELKFIGRHQLSEYANGIPHKYTLQIQHQLACTGWKRGWLLAMCANEPLLFEVERHERIIEHIVAKADEFMRCVESGDPPEIDGTSATSAALAQQFPQSQPSKVERLGEKYHKYGMMLERAKERRKRAEAMEAEMASRIKAAMGDAELAYVEAGDESIAWSWKSSKKSRTFRPCSALKHEILKHKAMGGVR